MKNYIIKTERLGLRNWLPNDVKPFSEMCQDAEVMKYFPKLLSKEESEDFINRMQVHFKTYGFCYFAVDILETEEFIGFTGMLHQEFKSEYTPCVDIGWRLKRSAWEKGFATEAAKACIDFSFNQLNLNDIYSFTPDINKGSEAVMKKIGMIYLGTFQHPNIINDSQIKDCLVYNITQTTSGYNQNSIR